NDHRTRSRGLVPTYHGSTKALIPHTSRSFHDLTTCRRHAGESCRMLGWLGRGGVFRNQLSLLDPVVKFVTATFICGRQRLRFAFGAFGWAGKADMKIILVVPPRSNFYEPSMTGTRLAAQSLL